MLCYEKKARLAKACPFCGNGVVKTHKTEWLKEGNIKVVMIKCDNCGAEVHAYTNECDPAGGYRKALKMWNRRATA